MIEIAPESLVILKWISFGGLVSLAWCTFKEWNEYKYKRDIHQRIQEEKFVAMVRDNAVNMTARVFRMNGITIRSDFADWHLFYMMCATSKTTFFCM